MHIPAHSGGPDGVETIVRVFAETVGRVVSDVDAHRVAAVVRVTDRAVLGERVSTRSTSVMSCSVSGVSDDSTSSILGNCSSPVETCLPGNGNLVIVYSFSLSRIPIQFLVSRHIYFSGFRYRVLRLSNGKSLLPTFSGS